ncbi:F0F1 ATP synthase subunit A [Streptococcus danieliae]|uniref:ATP synthase subunit a n=1 Tax=Streptococcus danieliae TaxID=747656 RepID=A0A7Z0S5U3_9STRE|nr:F0F1 ATP synthase subunit A [Streptococcus danieliae]MBF0698918.1 F0F1 ATP synthase subunit A [Streptococcus danieliae]NYS96095.1 F0F1 ATP synthase subunit A [Streptococcus danieliae]
MESHSPTIAIGPIVFDLTLLAMSLLTVALVFGFVYWLSRDLQVRPNRKQSALEALIEFVTGVIQNNLGASNVRTYLPIFFSLFLFLLVANSIGLATKIETPAPEHYNLWTSPTANLAYDLSLSFLVTVFIQVEGIRRQGFKNYFRAFATPVAMTPMNILEEITNFLSLALRLYGNIFSGEIIVSLLTQLIATYLIAFPFAFGLNMAWTAFSIFISGMQAFVFTMLSSSYLGKKINAEEV